jgi:inner membrane protein involved in colicin E2 resistance
LKEWNPLWKFLCIKGIVSSWFHMKDCLAMTIIIVQSVDFVRPSEHSSYCAIILIGLIFLSYLV